MLKRAFTYVETIVAVFICLLVLIPTIKINLKQIHTYKKIKEYESDLMFFNSLINHIKAEKIFIESPQKLKFNSYENLVKNKLFENFSNLDKEKKFNLKLDIEVSNMDFYLKNYPVNIFKIEFRKNKINFTDNIVKFKN